MSYMKARIGNPADLAELHAQMLADRRNAEDENIERLRWELDRAVSNLVEALMRREQRRNDEAGRRADVEIAAGRNPF